MFSVRVYFELRIAFINYKKLSSVCIYVYIYSFPKLDECSEVQIHQNMSICAMTYIRWASQLSIVALCCKTLQHDGNQTTSLECLCIC